MDSQVLDQTSREIVDSILPVAQQELGQHGAHKEHLNPVAPSPPSTEPKELFAPVVVFNVEALPEKSDDMGLTDELKKDLTAAKSDIQTSSEGVKNAANELASDAGVVNDVKEDVSEVVDAVHAKRSLLGRILNFALLGTAPFRHHVDHVDSNLYPTVMATLSTFAVVIAVQNGFGMVFFIFGITMAILLSLAKKLEEEVEDKTVKVKEAVAEAAENTATDVVDVIVKKDKGQLNAGEHIETSTKSEAKEVFLDGRGYVKEKSASQKTTDLAHHVAEKSTEVSAIVTEKNPEVGSVVSSVAHTAETQHTAREILEKFRKERAAAAAANAISDSSPSESLLPPSALKSKVIHAVLSLLGCALNFNLLGTAPFCFYYHHLDSNTYPTVMATLSIYGVGFFIAVLNGFGMIFLVFGFLMTILLSLGKKYNYAIQALESLEVTNRTAKQLLSCKDATKQKLQRINDMLKARNAELSSENEELAPLKEKVFMLNAENYEQRERIFAGERRVRDLEHEVENLKSVNQKQPPSRPVAIVQPFRLPG